VRRLPCLFASEVGLLLPPDPWGGGCRMVCELRWCCLVLLRSMYLLVCIWLMEGMVSRGPGVWDRGRKGGIHGAPFVL
jgi:hypothetical protein